MAATLALKAQILINALYGNTVGAALGQAANEQSNVYNWTSGTGANQADKIYSATITRTHGAPTGDLDLAGALADAFGTTITMVRVKGIIVLADAGNVNSVVVGGGVTAPITKIFFDYVATAAAQPAIKVAPGGILCLLAPQQVAYTITATTADKLQIASADEDASTPVTATVIIIGASA